MLVEGAVGLISEVRTRRDDGVPLARIGCEEVRAEVLVEKAIDRHGARVSRCESPKPLVSCTRSERVATTVLRSPASDVKKCVPKRVSKKRYTAEAADVEVDDVKVDDVEPAGVKPVDVEPADVKTVEPAGVKTVEPAGVKTVEPAGVKTVEPAGVKTAGVKPVDVEPAGVELADIESGGVEPADGELGGVADPPPFWKPAGSPALILLMTLVVICRFDCPLPRLFGVSVKSDSV